MAQVDAGHPAPDEAIFRAPTGDRNGPRNSRLPEPRNAQKLKPVVHGTQFFQRKIRMMSIIPSPVDGADHKTGRSAWVAEHRVKILILVSNIAAAPVRTVHYNFALPGRASGLPHELANALHKIAERRPNG